MNQTTRTVTIVGAGVAGLTIGYQLARQGYRVTVIEKNDVVGGLGRTFHYGDFHFDVGPHRFHTENPRVAKFIRDILQEAIDAGSTLRIDLTDGVGSYFGTTERFWRVYERAGEPCVNCGTKIKRVVQGGRSTYYCPRCQRR